MFKTCRHDASFFFGAFLEGCFFLFPTNSIVFPEYIYTNVIKQFNKQYLTILCYILDSFVSIFCFISSIKLSKRNHSKKVLCPSNKKQYVVIE